MRIRNETHEPLAISIGDETVNLEPGEETEIDPLATEIVILPTAEPHFVSQMEICPS